MITGQQIKATLKAAGFNTKDIRVTKGYKTYNIVLNDWKVEQLKVFAAVSFLDTCENISHDADPIYIGNSVSVTYNDATLNKDLAEKVAAAIANESQFSIYNHASVMNLAFKLSNTEDFKHLSRMAIGSAIHAVAYAKVGAA